jgi:hypothetical protein
MQRPLGWRAGRLLRRLAPGVRVDLLRVLLSPENVRADVIRQFWERPAARNLAEVLIDLEADDLLRHEVIEELRATDDSRSHEDWR